MPLSGDSLSVWILLDHLYGFLYFFLFLYFCIEFLFFFFFAIWKSPLPQFLVNVQVIERKNPAIGSDVCTPAPQATLSVEVIFMLKINL